MKLLNLELDDIQESKSTLDNNNGKDKGKMSLKELIFKKENIKINNKGLFMKNKKYKINISDIEFKEEIGKGSFGIVKRAFYKKLNKDIAVKKIKCFNKDKRFNIIADLKNLLLIQDKGNIFIEFYGAFFQEGYVMILLELMDYGSLKNFLRQKIKTIDETILFGIIIQILNSLNYLHHINNQIHLDLKLDNVLINSKGIVKLSDFGISKKLKNTNEFLKSFIGTIIYMSPERLLTNSYNHLSDIWSIGIIVIELYLGQLPEEFNKNYINLVQFYKENNNVDLSFLNVYKNDYLKDFVSNCLKIDFKKRKNTFDLLNHNWIHNNIINNKLDKYYDKFN